MFDEVEHEKRFQREYLKESLFQFRISFMLVTFLYGFFAVLDLLLAPDYLPLFLGIRFIVVIPFLLFVFAFSFTRVFERSWQILLFLSFIISGSGVSIMIALNPDNIIYFLGLDLIFIAGYFFIKLRCFLASLAGWNLILIFNFTVIIFSRMDWAMLFAANFFFVSGNIISSFACYYIEKNQRQVFKTKLKLEENQFELQIHEESLEEAVSKKTKELDLAYDAVIESMALITEYRDRETGLHIQRTKEFVRLLAQHLRSNSSQEYKLSEYEIELLVKTAPLHDLGKVAIPDYILLKPGKLTQQEFERMKIHTLSGAGAIRKSAQNTGETPFSKMAAEIAEFHHEKWNGSGYPHGLKGKAIPLTARIMALADVYDALISERPYKRALTHDKAYEIILAETGKHFDPVIVEAFIELQEEFKRLSLLKSVQQKT